jgi:hypothetical protein
LNSSLIETPTYPFVQETNGRNKILYKGIADTIGDETTERKIEKSQFRIYAGIFI